MRTSVLIMGVITGEEVDYRTLFPINCFYIMEISLYNGAKNGEFIMSSIQVSLPSHFNRRTMYEFLAGLFDGDRNPQHDNIEFDFTTLRFIEPVGITVISNITQYLLNKGVKVRYVTPNKKHFNKYGALVYLDDSQYFKLYLGETRRHNACVRPTTIPLENVKVASSYAWFEKVLNWLSFSVNISVNSLVDLKMPLQEIFNNIKDHSRENIGCSFIQHYPKKDEVQIAISDFGVGIPYNIQSKLPSLNDAESLEKAIEHGFSTRSTPQNRGAGLDNLIYNVVKNNKGEVFIHSNHGILHCKNVNNELCTKSSLSRIYYPGTLIQINLRTDTFPDLIEEEDFEWDF